MTRVDHLRLQTGTKKICIGGVKMRKSSAGRWARFLALVAIVGGVGGATLGVGLTSIGSQAASAATAVAPEIPGADWLSGNGVNVCYPVGTPCAGTTAFGAEGTDNWQCEELAARLWTTLNWYSGGWTQYAYQLYGGLASSQVTDYPNDGSYVPVPGDLIIHGANDGFAEGAGHVAVVDYVDPGTLTIHAVEENVAPAYETSPGRGTYVFGGGHWTRQGTSASPIGFVHANANPGHWGTPIHTAAALIPNDGASGYTVDGYGGLHPFGNAPAVSPSATWPGWDIARSIAVIGRGQGYVLDGYGGLHPFGGAPALADPFYPGWDIARAVALCPGSHVGYVLDGYGGLHPVGSPPAMADSFYPGWDIAKGLVLNSTCTGGYVLDGYGGVHPIGNAPPVTVTGYWSGWDIARSITMVSDTAGFVLDGYGGLHPFAASGTPMPPAPSGAVYQGGSDVFRSVVLDAEGGTGVQVSAFVAQPDGTLTGGQVNTITEPLIHTAVGLIPNDGVSGYVLDGYGGLHPFGSAPAVTASATWPGWDIARSIAVTHPGKGYVLDGYGGLHPFGGAPALSDSFYPGWDIARAVALCPGGKVGYVLDGYGGLHPVGNAPAMADSFYPGWDIARGLVLNSTCTGGYVLDGYGGVHPIGTAPAVTVTGYWSGWDIARSITLVSNTAGYVLEGYGGLHPFAANTKSMPPGLANSQYDSAGTDPFDAVAYSLRAKAGVAVTRSYSSGEFWTAPLG